VDESNDMDGAEGNLMGIGGVEVGVQGSGHAQDIVFDVSSASVDALLASDVIGGPCGMSKAIDMKETGGPATGEGANGLLVGDIVLS
jgi:hypothetical protein